MQQSGHTIPFIDILNNILSFDKDAQSNSELASQLTARANTTIELTKSLFSRLEKQDLTFETPREIEDTLNVLAYGFVPPISQFIKDDHNYLKQIILIYDFIISDEVDLKREGGKIKVINTKPVLDLNDYQHQEIFIKMLSHGVLLFDRKNFERKISTPGGEGRTREEEFRVPTRLCNMMIRIYHRFLYRAYPYLYIDHWEYLIKLFSGLAIFIIQSPTDAKYSDRINVAVVELLYNTWIFSGVQNESIWNLFKHNILELITKDFVVSYWIDICSELTTKLLIDYKCYDPPKLVLVSREDEEIECHDNLLIIHHNYTFRRSSSVQSSAKKFSLFRQPFLFNISKDQVLYLWGKMVNMMPTSINNPKASLLIIEGIQNVIYRLLSLGSHSKPKEEVQESTIYSGYSEYQIENKRTIKIEHDFQHFQKILSYITTHDKIRKNTKKPLTDSPTPTPKTQQSEEEKDFVIRTKKSYAEEEESTPTLIFKKKQDDQSPTLNGAKEYSWIVKTDKLPGGDSLIKLFGKLLFDSAALTTPHFEEVRLNALNILCQIFTKAAGPFSEGATKKFYKTYLDYLESDIPWSHLQTLLKNSTDLFLVNHLSHIIILQKPLIMKLVEFYTKVKMESPAQEKVFRRAANKLCSSFLCFMNDEYGLINEVYRYDKNVKDIISELLELAFQKDRDALINQRGNSVKVLDEAKILAQSCWNLLIYSILNYKIYSFVQKINDTWLDKNSPTMTDLALDMLLDVGEMCLMRLDEFEIPCPMTEDVFLSALNIIERMRKYIEQRTKDLNEINKQSQPKVSEKEDALRHISQAFGILYTWLHLIIHLKEVETNNEFPEVFEEIIKMLISYQNYDFMDSSIKCMLASLFNRLGNLSFSRNNPISSSIVLNTDPVLGKSYEEISAKIEDKCLLTIAIGEDTLLSFYNLPLESTNEVLVFMIRNSAGKFVWFGELFYKLFSPVKNQEEEDNTKNNILEEVKKPPKDDENLKQRGLSSEMLSSPRSGGPNQELDFLLQQQFDFEDQYEETHSKLKSVQIKDKSVSEGGISTSPEPEKEVKTANELNAIKMFLLNTGILSLKDLDKLTHIPSESAAKQAIKKLDFCPSRCQILTSIFYAKMPSSDKLDEFPRYDKLFRKFIEELGVVVDDITLESGAYEGIRNYVTQHKKVLFTSDPLYEMIFTLPNLTQDYKDIQESASISPIVIIWNAKLFTRKESFYPYIINQLDLKGYRTALIITPLDESYFSLNILKKDSDFMIFPPINEFVCSNHMLVNVVMQIVKSVHREYEYCHHKRLYHEITLGKLAERQNQISELVETYRRNEYSWEVLKACLGVPITTDHP